jgi:starch-binding outer membrane protein, SusD/RagB family
MNKFKILVAIFALFAASCTDLQEEILDEQDGAKLVSDVKNVEMIVAPSYAYLRDLQSRSGVWLAIEACTDEVAFPTRGANWNSADYRTLFTHDYDSKNGYIKNTWNSFLIGMTKCNVSLQYLEQLEQTDVVKGYIAEVRFIRALAMYMLNDCFAQVPFREASEYDYFKQPQILTRAQAIERIIKELNEIIPVLKTKAQVPYGRISKAAAQMLLAKVYLNYQVYTGTAPAFTDGTAKWDETIALCDQIISSNQYVLADDFWKLYLADNAAYSAATETILPIIYNTAVSLGGAAWVNQTLGYNQTFGNYSSLWNGCCTTPDFLTTWDVNDPRYKDDRLKSKCGFNLGFLVGQQYNIAGVALKTKTNLPLVFTPDFSISNSVEEAGVRVVKYAPDPATVNPGNSENDYQYFRLADVYLMRAEAKLRKGDADGALADINVLRAKRNVATYSKAELTLDKILNERGFEFYWEHHRRNDLIRFNKFCSARYQKPNLTPGYKVIFPIPLTALEANPSLKQNPGYN